VKLTPRTCTLLSASVLLPLLSYAEQDNLAERLSFSGDLRLRYETIDEDSAPSRERARYRARLAMTAKASDKVQVVLQLASAADDPVSRNVTFDGGFSADDIGFDLAYADWAPIDGMHVFAGKMRNPLYRAGGNGLIWDGDLNPEGLALHYEKGRFFGTVGHFWVEERSTDDDSTLSAVQFGAHFKLGDNARLTAGVGYFAFSNTIGNQPFYDGSPKGNSVDAQLNYLYEFKDTEVFAQFDTGIGDLPLQLFVHTTQNAEVDDQDTGIVYGVKLGSAKNDGDWEVGLAWQDIEADAVIGTFSDSDFGGGGTDADGLLLKAKYAVNPNISLAASWFGNSINVSSLPEEDYDRLQLDVEFKFK
jgi:hypothetical protein